MPDPNIPASRSTIVGLGNGHRAIRTAYNRTKTRSLLPILHAKHTSRFGFWNLQKSIARDPSRHDDLTLQLRSLNIDVCGLAGAWRWETGAHHREGHTILWSGSPSSAGHGSGVGLYLTRQAHAALQWWNPVSDRILVARFKGTINLTVVVVYAPHTGTGQQPRTAFFRKLEQQLAAIPGLDYQLVLGDFNSRVGSAVSPVDGHGVLGSHGYGERNAAGNEMLEFCRRASLCVANTFFRHRGARKATWRNPAGGRAAIAGLACLDYVLVKRQWLSSVRNVRVCRSADPAPPHLSDHRLVVCSLQLSLRPGVRRERRPQPDRAALEEEEVQRRFVAAVETRLAPGGAAPPVDCWEELAGGVVAAAAATLPPQPSRRPSQVDASGTTLRLIALRREALAQLKTRRSRQQRAELSRIVRKLTHKVARARKRDKSRAARQLAERLAILAGRGDSHGFYAEARAAAGGGKAPTPQLQGADGPSPEAQTAAFAAHFEALHSGGNHADADAVSGLSAAASAADWALPTLAHTMAAVKKLKRWRAADPAGVSAELLQATCRSPAVAVKLHRIIISSLEEGMPAAVKESELLPFFKKGDATNPSNYRGIQIISMLRKVVALILSEELCRRLEPGLLEYQCGFRPRRSCTDQIFALRKLSELSIEWQQRLYVGFVDLAKAFDSIPRPALWAVLRARGLPESLVRCVVDLHTDTSCRVRVGGQRSRSFKMEFGVQQGCPLATILFNVFFDHVVQEALAECPDAGITVRRRAEMGADLLQPGVRAGERRAPAVALLTVPVLMLADDLAILAPDAAGLQRFLAAFHAACERWGLVISTEKTELMLMGGAAALACEDCGRQQPERDMLVCDGCQRGWHARCLSPPMLRAREGDWCCPGCVARGGGEDAWRPPITVRREELRWVDKFKYLGSVFESGGSLEGELARRISLATHAFHLHERHVFRQRCIPLRTRVHVYTSLVMSVLLYGSESWALSDAQLERLEVFHRSRLRAILGVRMSQRIPNTDLLARCRTDTIATLLARRQLRWVGHLGRMPDTRLAKMLLHSTMRAPGRARRLGRPRGGLCQAYTALINGHMTRAAISRRLGVDTPRGETWLDWCQSREFFRSLLP